MLWLRDEDLSALSGLEVTNTFMIGSVIYVVGNVQSESWKMYSINIDNFAIKEVPVRCHNFDPTSHETFADAIVVHKGVAYLFSHTILLAGKFEDDAFHWRVTETTGPQPRQSGCIKNSVGIFEENSTKYVTMVQDQYALTEEQEEEGLQDLAYYKCELDLDTLVWTRTETVIPDEEDLRYIDYSFTRILAARTNLHAVRHGTTIDSGFHMVMNRAAEEWRVAGGLEWRYEMSSNDDQCTVFTVRDTVYKIGYMKNVDECALAIFRYNEAANKWEKVAERPSALRELGVDHHNLVINGSRVYIIGYKYGRSLMSPARLDHLIAFDLGVPSLFDLSMGIIQQDKSLKEFAMERLLGTTLLERFTRDSTGDSLVPPENDRMERNFAAMIGSLTQGLENFEVPDFSM